jgi:hypothetical protein
MRRLWLPLLLVVLLAACSSAPQKTAYRSGGSHGSGRAYQTRPPGFPDFVDHSVGREEVSIEAMGLVGIPYRWGGNTPDSGFDCSGLVHYVLARAADVNLPRTTAEMSTRGEPIEPDQIAAGDLVFFNTTGRPHSHVGIYVGKLRFVNAPSTGGTVRLDYLTNPYWAKRFDGIRRVAPAKRAPTPFDAPTWEASAPTTPAAPADAAAMAAQTSPAAVVGLAAAPGAPAMAATRAPAASSAYSTSNAAVLAARPSRAATGTFATSAAPTASTPVIAASPPADAFEPPPPALSAAQRQAVAAGAVTPPIAPSSGPAATSIPTTTATNAPDAIDAAADAFEPPPPAAALAARQAAQAQAQPIPVTRGPAPDLAPPADDPPQVLRASTAARGMPATTQTSDDPIARFANGGY